MSAAEVALKPCIAYQAGKLVCTNGFPQLPSCRDGQDRAPHCLNDDYAPPHIICRDTGKPLLAAWNRRAPERNPDNS